MSKKYSVRAVFTEGKPYKCVDELIDMGSGPLVDLHLHTVDTDPDTGKKVIDVTFSSDFFEDMKSMINGTVEEYRAEDNSDVEVKYV